MRKCNDCPFLCVTTDCSIGYLTNFIVDNVNEEVDVDSEDCKLEIAQYSLKDNPNSVTFLPKDINEI